MQFPARIASRGEFEFSVMRRGLQLSNHRTGQRGQTLVEFVMIAVFFMSIMLLMIQITFIHSAQSLVNVGSYLGARQIAVKQDDPLLLQETVDQYLSPIAKNRQVDAWISNYPENYGEEYRTWTAIDYPLVVPLVRQFYSNIHRTNPTAGETRVVRGTSPPTRESLGLQPGQFFVILNRKEIGYVKYNWTVYITEKYTFKIIISWHHSYTEHGPYYRTYPFGQTPTPGDFGYHNHSANLGIRRWEYWLDTSKSVAKPDGPILYDYTVEIFNQGQIYKDDTSVQLSNWIIMSAD